MSVCVIRSSRCIPRPHWTYLEQHSLIQPLHIRTETSGGCVLTPHVQRSIEVRVRTTHAATLDHRAVPSNYFFSSSLKIVLAPLADLSAQVA